jgi:hypothetical protein
MQTSTCNIYTVQSVQSKVNRAAPCPFIKRTCMNPAVAIDSGLVDSHIHLGINALAHDRVQFRRLTTCTPILLEEEYSSNWTSETAPGLQTQLLLQLGQTLVAPGDSYKYYYLGNRTWNAASVSDSTVVVSNNTIIYASQPYNLL